MMYIYAYHIIPHIIIYIYAVVPWIVEKTQYSVNKQCSSTLCNFTLERVLEYNTSLKEYY